MLNSGNFTKKRSCQTYFTEKFQKFWKSLFWSAWKHFWAPVGENALSYVYHWDVCFANFDLKKQRYAKKIP